MANTRTNFERIIILVFLGLLGPVITVASLVVGTAPHPILVQESIVPERDLTPRNFNPHPYVSAFVAGTTNVLSNFDHPYASVASKRSGYFRNVSNVGVYHRQHYQLDNETGKTSINSLANFARRFLRLKMNEEEGYNGKKSNGVAGTNDAIIENVEYYPSVKFHSNILGAIGTVSGKHRTIITDYPGLYKNGKNIVKKFSNGYYDTESDDDDRDTDVSHGDGNVGSIGTLLLPYSRLKDQREKQKLYLGKTLNLASVQQSSLNEDALSLRDTNDNLSQGLYVTTDEDEHRVSDVFSYSGQDHGWLDAGDSLLRGIESHKKLSYFITPNSNYRNSFNDQLYHDTKRYSLYL